MPGGAARTPLRFRRLRWAVPIVVVALLSFGASARAATVTVGSPLTQTFIPKKIGKFLTMTNFALPEPEVHAFSPISGTIVRWRVLGATGGPFRLRVLRFAGNPGMTGTGTSSPETPASLGVETFATNLPIQAGEFIGIDNSATTDTLGLAEGLPGVAAIATWEPPLAEGSTRIPTVLSEDQAAFNADVQPPPSVSSISPVSGPSTGGTAVTIAGSDFAGVSAVDFGGLPAASYSVDSESRIVAKSPVAPPGPVDVTVTTVAGRSPIVPADGFIFTTVPAPVLSPVVCVVPKLKGRKLKPAKRTLRKRHCRIGKVTRKRRARALRKAKIVTQRPRPGSIRPAGSKVNVTLLVRKKAQLSLGRGPRTARRSAPRP